MLIESANAFNKNMDDELNPDRTDSLCDLEDQILRRIGVLKSETKELQSKIDGLNERYDNSEINR
ncbi:hypothetical protein KO527_22785 [Pseudoalteromonas sp. C2R02]|uniref:hypothetical protein n=1 Tax=Pseudoalteromonas sp. C2R02 TaxID=2841565 RepID=UPI001C0A0DFC|nr:hypothetical protein [Pseudoalteromonas sp. C2R02]MBU2972169.1 hypothetical protein [Pseudoalteromonas sp. C2R02]